MAKKSKTQKAKASANRAAKKEAKLKAEQEEQVKASQPKEEKEETKKGRFFKKKEDNKQEPEKTQAQIRQERRDAKMAAKENKAPKKHGKVVQFFIDVKAEMRRVTWPTKKDVIQWTGVVVAALIFFGVYVAVLDSFIVTPLLVAISGIGA